MSTNTANGLLFIIAGLTPFIVYLGLGPDGTAVLDQARAEQLFAYLFFSLPLTTVSQPAQQVIFLRLHFPRLL